MHPTLQFFNLSNQNIIFPNSPANKACPIRILQIFVQIWDFSICQEVSVISQIATAFHRIRPPLIIRSRLPIIRMMSLLFFPRPTQLILQFRLFSDRWSVVVRWFHDNSSQYFPNSNKLYERITFGFCDGFRIFRKVFSVSCEVLVWHGFHWVARTGTTTAYRSLFRDSRPSLRTLCSAVIKSPYFSVRRIDLFWFLLNKAWKLCFRFCVSTFEASPSESEFSLSEECASTSVSRSSRFTAMGCNQTRMPCVGSSLFVSSAASRFPACMLVTSSCHWIWQCSQFSGIIRLFLWSRCWRQKCCWNMTTILIQREVLSCPSYKHCLHNLGQLWSFVVFHSYEYPRFEQNWCSNRIAGVSSSNCTVTNRSRSWTKTCAYSFICTAPDRGKSLVVFWTLSKYPLCLSSILLAQLCALKLPYPQWAHDLLCFWRLHKRLKRSFYVRLWACIFSRQIPRYFAGQICLWWGFLRCFFSILDAQGFRSWGSPFLDNASRLPFSFPIF